MVLDLKMGGQVRLLCFADGALELEVADITPRAQLPYEVRQSVSAHLSELNYTSRTISEITSSLIVFTEAMPGVRVRQLSG